MSAENNAFIKHKKTTTQYGLCYTTGEIFLAMQR